MVAVVLVRGPVGAATTVISPAQKLKVLTAYESACENSEGGAFLRREGL
ncbi:hypothetical protein [Pseudarthrobacter sp. NIBRBAC000502772]|nr:hypothetical protein [Pseudarthrobacter sp. NIBRBAC000502772]